MDLVALVHVVAATQPGPAHAAAFEGVCERSLDELTAPSHRCLAHRGAKAIAVGVDCLAGILVAVPAQKFLALRFGDACLPHSSPTRACFSPEKQHLLGNSVTLSIT